MDSPRLTYPAQQQGQHLLVETDPSKLKQWLKSLPYGDMARTVPEVCRAIASLNRTEISISTRKELVNQFDKTYAQIFETYRPIAAHVTSAEGRRKENENLHHLTREMSFAHKIITDVEIHKKKLWGKNKDLIKSINLSLHYLGLLLMEHYESYSPIPIYLWRECNGLYGFAQHREIEDIEIFKEGLHQCLPSIEATFARTCLLSASDPYHLSPGEHWQLFKYLERWVYLSEYSDDPNDFSDTQCFVINQNSQLKPVFAAQFKGDPLDEDVCFLLTFDIIRQVKYQLDELSRKNTMPEGFYKDIRLTTAQSLLEHMSAHWNARVERKGRRYPVITRLDIIWGISSIYKLLEKHRLSPNATHWEAETIESFLKDEHSIPMQWEASNVSDGGIGISSVNNIAHLLRVGEIVIIREYIDKKPSFRWRPAICRWQFGDDNHGTSAGLEFIDGAVEPSRIFNKMSTNKNSQGQPALLLRPREITAKTPLSLIASRGSYRAGRDFTLKTKAKVKNIKARKETMVTPCVEFFQYQITEVLEVIEPEEHDSELNDGSIPWTSVPNYQEEEPEKHDDHEINLDSVRLPGDH
ncbi:hypothetical protein [Pleionea sediminis]|uniref:hypothetical protein n=1 Tax=Pleionea sediminis TaxID=2569479 RepID=UPI001186ACF9|nr:hypothetical protein [Pleionea sediminis]